MTTRSGTTSRKGQHEIELLGRKLDASEIAQINRRIASGHGPHYEYEKFDAEAQQWRCAPDCPDCVHRELVRRYRAAVRARVITRGHRENRRIVGSVEQLQAKLRTARARYDGNDDASRMNEYGEILPAPRSTRERIDLAAEIEMMEIDIDTLKERRAAKCRNPFAADRDEGSILRDLGIE